MGLLVQPCLGSERRHPEKSRAEAEADSGHAFSSWTPNLLQKVSTGLAMLPTVSLSWLPIQKASKEGLG